MLIIIRSQLSEYTFVQLCRRSDEYNKYWRIGQHVQFLAEDSENYASFEENLAEPPEGQAVF
jgi:hypothetical protein